MENIPQASELQMKAEIENNFRQVMIFERPYLQEDAQEIMPHKLLSQKAKERESAIASNEGQLSKPLDYQVRI